MKPKRFAYVFIAVIFALSTAVVRAQEGGAPGMGGEPPPQSEEGYSPNMPAPNVPPVITLPAGTLVTVRTTQTLSSDHNRTGDSFTTILDQALIAQGWVVARRGQIVMGKVVEAQKASPSNSSSQLAIELNELSLVDGQPMPIRTELVQVAGSNPSRVRNDGAIVGTTAGTGAVIGAIAGGGTGAAIGAAIGAAAGVAGVLSTQGRPTEIYPEAQLTFRLKDPVAISTEQSQQAFLPVTPGDYDRGPARNPDRYPSTRGYPPPATPYYYYDEPYYYGYYGYYGYYPYTYYGYYGYGPRYYYPGPRVYIRPGYRGGRR